MRLWLCHGLVSRLRKGFLLLSSLLRECWHLNRAQAVTVALDLHSGSTDILIHTVACTWLSC